jgi:hypothetical protein
VAISHYNRLFEILLTKIIPASFNLAATTFLRKTAELLLKETKTYQPDTETWRYVNTLLTYSYCLSSIKSGIIFMVKVLDKRHL